MLILAIESSQKKFIVALFDDEKILSSKEEEGARIASREIALFVEYVLTKASKTITDVDNVFINSGPGSFTGLRVSTSFVLGLSAVIGAKLYTYSAFDLLEYAVKNKNSINVVESKTDEFYVKEYNKDIQTILKSELAVKNDKQLVCFENEQVEEKNVIRIELNAKLIFDYFSAKKEILTASDHILINYYHEFKKK